MKTILMSIKPEWCELIASGKKTKEVRKTASLETPFRVVMYCTKNLSNRRHFRWGNEIFYATNNKEVWSGKVIGEFICNKVDMYRYDKDFLNEKENMYYITCGELEETCLTYEELCNYGKGKTLYGLHITDLKLYDKPRELGEFRKPCGDCIGKCTGEHYDRCQWQTITRPPQSYMRIEEV